MGKYLLIYDGECVICDASVTGLIEKDDDRLIMFSSMHDRYSLDCATLRNCIVIIFIHFIIERFSCSKSQRILSAFGVSESTFHAEKNSTVFVITPFGEVLTHSDALLALLKVLPGTHHMALYTMFKTLPRFGRDRVYTYIAANRHSLLGNGKPADACTVLSARPADERDRFL